MEKLNESLVLTRSVSPSLIVLFAVAVLGAMILLPWADAASKSVALGAIIGVIGGHLNGYQSGANAGSTTQSSKTTESSKSES